MITACRITKKRVEWITSDQTVIAKELDGPARVLYDGESVLIHQVSASEDLFELFGESGEPCARLTLARAEYDSVLAMYVCSLQEYSWCVRVTERRAGGWRDVIYCYDGDWRVYRCTPELLMEIR